MIVFSDERPHFSRPHTVDYLSEPLSDLSQDYLISSVVPSKPSSKKTSGGAAARGAVSRRPLSTSSTRSSNSAKGSGLRTLGTVKESVAFINGLTHVIDSRITFSSGNNTKPARALRQKPAIDCKDAYGPIERVVMYTASRGNAEASVPENKVVDGADNNSNSENIPPIEKDVKAKAIVMTVHTLSGCCLLHIPVDEKEESTRTNISSNRSTLAENRSKSVSALAKRNGQQNRGNKRVEFNKSSLTAHSKVVASRAKNKTVKKSAEKWKLAGVISEGEEQGIIHASFSPCGHYVITVAAHALGLTLWDLSVATSSGSSETVPVTATRNPRAISRSRSTIRSNIRNGPGATSSGTSESGPIPTTRNPRSRSAMRPRIRNGPAVTNEKAINDRPVVAYVIKYIKEPMMPPSSNTKVESSSSETCHNYIEVFDTIAWSSDSNILAVVLRRDGRDSIGIYRKISDSIKSNGYKWERMGEEFSICPTLSLTDNFGERMYNDTNQDQNSLENDSSKNLDGTPISSSKFCSTDIANISFINNDREIVAIDSSLEYHVVVYSLDGTLISRFRPQSYCLGVKNIIFSPCKSLLALGGYDGNVRLWNTFTHRASLNLQHTQIEDIPKILICKTMKSYSEVQSLPSLTIDGECVTMHSTHMFTPELPKVLPTVSIDYSKPCPKVGVGLMSWSNDGKYLVTRNDEMPTVLWLWDLSEMGLCCIITFIKPIRLIKFSPVKNQLAVGTGSNKLFIWSAEEGISAFGCPNEQFEVIGLRWQPDGKAVTLVGRSTFYTCRFIINDANDHVLDLNEK